MKIKLNKILFCLFLFATALQSVFSQTTVVPKFQSPNVAQMEKFGEIPVSLFTGTPNISIPIYELVQGPIKAPINLSYHPASAKPTQQPGWVGFGWNLQCGGVITRKVNNELDEKEHPTDNTNGTFHSYYPSTKNEPYASNHNSSSISSSSGSGSTIFQGNNWYNTTALKLFQFYPWLPQRYDTEADEFNFNFMGHSGSFYYDPDKGWVVNSEESIKIVFSDYDFLSSGEMSDILNEFHPKINSNPRERWSTTTTSTIGMSKRFFKKFTLITEDGTKYIFGGNDKTDRLKDAMEFTIPFTDTGSSFKTQCNTWLLQRIESPTGDYVKFEYERSYITCSLGLDYYYNKVGCDYSYSAPGMWFGNSGSQSNWSNKQISEGNKLTGNYILPMYLSKISGGIKDGFNDSDMQTISFSSSVATTLQYDTKYGLLDGYNNGSDENGHLYLVDYNIDNLKVKKLDGITIKDRKGNTIRSFDFNYTQNSSQRFTLDKLYERGTSSNKKEYSFTYNDVAGLPGLNGDKTDHWGSYNGKSVMDISDPSLIFDKRQTDTLYATKGLLTSIKYPTGGYTEFTWQAHKYSFLVSRDRQSLTYENGYAGGGRIAEIRNYSDNGILATKKKYYYVKNYSTTSNLSTLLSSGVLNGKPEYLRTIRRRSSNDNINVYSQEGTYNSLANYSFSGNGSHIGYDEVVEVNTDGSYKKYFFTNYGQDRNGIEHYDQRPMGTLGWIEGEDSYMPFSSLECERGKTVGIEDYNSKNKLINQSRTFYRGDVARFDTFFDKQLIYNQKLYVCGDPNNTSTAMDNLVFAVAYKKFNYVYYPVLTYNTVYDTNGNNPVETISSFSYNSKNQLASKKITNSEGKEVETKTYYPIDLLSGQQPAEMAELVNTNHIDIPVKTENFVNGIRVSQEMTKFANYIGYRSILLPKEIHLVKGNSDIDLNTTINKKITYDSYDGNGNLLAYTIANGIKTGILWGYKDTLPIAKIENYNWGDISTITSNNLRTLSETGTEADLIAALNNLRNNPDLDDAMITTYTYKPLIGISTITDPKGYTTYYEYDDFNRLKYVKDKEGKVLSKNEYHYKGQ